MTIKYARLQGDRKDTYTILTFVFLGISTSIFLIHGVFIVTLKVLRAISNRGVDDDIYHWEVNNKEALVITAAVLNIAIGYLCQNLAYLANI